MRPSTAAYCCLLFEEARAGCINGRGKSRVGQTANTVAANKIKNRWPRGPSSPATEQTLLLDDVAGGKRIVTDQAGNAYLAT